MRSLGFRGTLSAVVAGLFIQACTTRDIVEVTVGSVNVNPQATSLLEGDSLQFSALVRDIRSNEVEAAEVEWSSSDPTKLSISPTGMAHAVARDTVEVVARFRGVEGRATVIIIPAPTIALDATEVAFFGGAGDAPPAARDVALTNGGGGTLGTLTVEGVEYGEGEPQGWLSASLAGATAPTTLVLTPATAGLGVGAYSATVSVASPDDRNSPVTLPVTLTLAGISVSESDGGTTVDEVGTASDAFTVALESQPESDVVLLVTSGDVGEVVVAPTTLTFTPSDWDQPQTVSVTGVQDAVADGDVVTAVTIAVDDDASDDLFDAVADRTVDVTTTDDDVAGIIVDPANGLVTTEEGGQATFTVVLDTEPTADVTIDLGSSDTSEGTPSPPSLTFTPADWNVAQTVTVTGQNDAIDDGDVVYSIITAPASSTDPGYDGQDAPDVYMTNTDDGDTAGIIVAPTSGLVTTETGGQAIFTVVLTSEPTASVTIGLSSSDPTEGSVLTSSLTFTRLNWNVARTVTVTSQDDALPDGIVAYTIVTAPATSNDANYAGIDADDVSVTNVDNETAGVTVSPASGPTTEAGGQATFTVVLNNQPSADVTITLSSNDTSEGTISTPMLTFTSANWSAQQTVTVTGQDDDLADGDVQYMIVTGAATSTDPNYDGIDPVDVSFTNVDDESAGIIVSAPSGPTTEAGGTAQVTVVLASQPAADVTIGLSSSETDEGTVSVSSLTFTTSTWSTPQVVTLTGQDDDVADGNVVYLLVTDPAVSADPDYSDLDAADIQITNVDDESAGITVSPINRPTTEAGGTAQFTVVLNTQPSASVTIALSSSDTSEGVLSTSSLTFTTLSWNAAQTVTVTGVNDDVDDDNVVYEIVTALAVSSDPDYDGIDPPDVVVTNVDNDTAGVVVSPNGLVTTESGGTAQFTVVLTSEPTTPVAIDLSSSDVGEGVVSTASLAFGPATWNVAQTVTVTGQDDALADGNVFYTIVTAPATSADPRYSGFNAGDVTVTNVDDETAGISVSPASGPTTESGEQATFTVALNAAPSAEVAIGLSSSNTAEGTVSTTLLTFTPANWNTPQPVTVTGQDDDVDDDNVVYTIVTAPAVSTDPLYDGLDAADVSITNVDDDRAGFTISPPTQPTTEAGGTASFTVVLDSRPADDVTLGMTSDAPAEGVILTAMPLLFTPSNWNVPQSVTVQGQDDDVADGNVVYTIVTAEAASGDFKYDGLSPADVTLTNIDDETVGITVSPASGPTTEAGGEATFTVVLNTQPTADVTIDVTSSNTTEGAVVSSTPLVFTSANWQTPQTVVIEGQDDDVDDDNVAYQVVTSPAVSADGDYDELDAADVAVTNIDDETAGVTVSPPTGATTEGGGTATFSLVLTSRPTGDVTIGLISSEPSEGEVTSAAPLVFTPGNWNSPQTVTVTGQDDVVVDPNNGYTIITSPTTSIDPKYDGLPVADVSLVNVDDETAGITVSQASGPTTEMGGEATFTVVLNNQPISNVSISLSTSDTSEGEVISANPLVFTQANWNQPQTVIVEGRDDDIDDDNVVYTIVTAPAVSGDPNYSGFNPSDVLIGNVDDETAGITVSPPSGPTTEAGGTATFTLVLNSQPTADVTIGVSSNDSSEGLVASTTPLLFTPGNWSVPQQVTVTGQDDDVDDGNVTYTVTTAPAVSIDSKYGGFDAADVPLTNVDDENAGFEISAPSGPTTEPGGQASFTVRLTSQPSADVTIGVSSSDTTEGTLWSPTSLTFTSADWSTVQTVTVRGVDDFDADGNVVYEIVLSPATSSDGQYHGLDPADVSMTNVDNETIGITVSAASGPTFETGESATFTVVLNTRPAANVTIGISSDDTTEGVVSHSSLTFTNSDWNVAQTVTVTGVDDDFDDGNVTYTVVTDPATSSDPSYQGLDPANVSFTNVDDDLSSFLVSPISGPTTETAGTATFSMVLTSRPAADVIVSLSSSDPTEGTVNPSNLTFTESDWDVAQIVTVTGQDDEIDDDNVSYSIVTAAATSSDANYDGVDPPDVSVTNVDDGDTAGIVVSPTSGLVTSEGSGTAQFTVVLTSEPTDNVTIGITSLDTSEGTVSHSSLTFTPSNWSSARTVTVTGVNDAIDDDDVPYVVQVGAGSSTDAKYAAINPPDVSLTNTDDGDTAGITVTPTIGLVTSESAGTAQFTVGLTSEPTGNVTIGLASLDTSEGAVSHSSLTFTPSNWSSARTVTVTGVDDAIDDGDVAYVVQVATPSSSDGKYSAIDPPDVSLTNIDDDEAQLSIGDVSATEGDIGSTNAVFTVSMSVESVQTVTVQYATSDGTATAGLDYTATSGTLTFDPGETSQTIPVPVLGDTAEEPTETFTVTLSNPVFASIIDDTGTGTINDNDDPPPSISIADRMVTEGDAGTVDAHFVVTLSGPSGLTVSVNYTTSGGTATAGADFASTSGTLSFAPGVTVDTVTVSVSSDLLDEDDETFSVTLSNPSNGTLGDDAGVGTITDNDPLPALTVVRGEVTEGDPPTTGVFNSTVTLNPPSGRTVAVDYATDDLTATAGVDYLATSGTLVFDPGVIVQPIPVTVIGDLVTEVNERFTIRLSNVVNATLAEAEDHSNINDDDPAGFAVSASGDTLVVTEGGPAGEDSFTVVLDHQPASDVVISVVSANTNEVQITSGATLTFTSSDWNVPQTVELQGGGSGGNDGNQFTDVTISIVDGSSNDLFDPLPDQVVVVESIDID